MQKIWWIYKYATELRSELVGRQHTRSPVLTELYFCTLALNNQSKIEIKKPLTICKGMQKYDNFKDKSDKKNWRPLE